MTLQHAQAWYVEETVATATPARLLCMLYDRLARDIGQGRTAFLENRRADAEDRLEHAVDIITELLTTLDGKVWPGAGDLARIYAWMTGQILTARVKGDAEALTPVHTMVMDLGRSWHEAADALEAGAA